VGLTNLLNRSPVLQTTRPPTEILLSGPFGNPVNTSSTEETGNDTPAIAITHFKYNSSHIPIRRDVWYETTKTLRNDSGQKKYNFCSIPSGQPFPNIERFPV